MFRPKLVLLLYETDNCSLSKESEIANEKRIY